MNQSQNYLKASLLIIALIAFISLFAQLSITISMIPITGQTLAIGIIASIFSLRIGLIVVISYLLLGALGFPIFANQKSGIDAILGATGGLLVGFIFYVITVRVCLNISKKIISFIGANLLATLITLIFGSAWLLCQQRFIYDESDQCCDDSFRCIRNHQIYTFSHHWLQFNAVFKTLESIMIN